MSFSIVLIYIICCYVRPVDYFPETAQYHVMFWFGLVAVGSVILDTVIGRIRVALRPQYWLMAGLVFAILISRIAHGWFGGAAIALYEFGVPVTLFFCVSVAVSSVARLRKLSLCLAVTFLLLAVQALAGYFGLISPQRFLVGSLDQETYDVSQQSQSPEEEGGPDDAPVGKSRIQSLGFLNDPNDFSQALLISLPLLACVWRSGRWARNTFLVLVPSIAILTALYLTYSRGALVGLTVLALVAFANRWGKVSALFLGFFVAVAGALAQIAAGRSFSMHDESAVGRFDAWGAGFDMFKHSPLFGVGFNMFTDNFSITAHNSYVLCFAELGLTGYFFWLSLLIVTARDLLQLRSQSIANNDAELGNWAQIISYALVAFLTTAFFLSRTYTITLYLLLGMAVALTQLSPPAVNRATQHRLNNWGRWTLAAEALSMTLVYVFIRISHLGGVA